MTSRSRALNGALAAGTVVLCLLPIAVAGQAPARSTPQAKKAAAPLRTSWGAPAIQGLWPITTTSPLERLREAADKTVLSEDEREALARQVAERLDQDK